MSKSFAIDGESPRISQKRANVEQGESRSIEKLEEIYYGDVVSKPICYVINRRIPIFGGFTQPSKQASSTKCGAIKK